MSHRIDLPVAWRPLGAVLAAAAALATVLMSAAPAAHAAGMRAGAAAVDASWHVGASAGQYASDGTFLGEHGVDPHTHSIRRAASYGMQSRLSTRALIVQGANGACHAIVKNDLYIAQDLLYRRTAQLIEADPEIQQACPLSRENLTIAVTHNHSSPYYSATAWGVWAFQDVYDIRFYLYMARQMHQAVKEAATGMKPAKVGAKAINFDLTHRHSYGPAGSDDGTPAGYPQGDADHHMVVVRVDGEDGKAIGTLVNYSLHPEGNEGNDLISGDWVAPLERMVDRATGGVMVFTQGATGTAEMERSTYHSMHDRLDFSHRNYAQNEYGAALMANAVIGAWKDVATLTEPVQGGAFKPGAVPFASDAEVGSDDRWFPGPLSHPVPTVSNCRTDRALAGNPQVPIVGLPDCGGPGTIGLPTAPEALGIEPIISTDDLQKAGIPVPENYSAPSYTGLEESVSVHLQAIRIGEILITVCSCEQWADQSRNIKSRTDREQDNVYRGFDWSQYCTQLPDQRWSCPNPGAVRRYVDPDNPGDLTVENAPNLPQLPPISDALYQRMKAQVNNDATGWDEESYVLWAESEPTDPAQIKGNFSRSELGVDKGYTLTVTVGMANDYNGYLASYREYQRGDHYRKALTGWGPHSQDYMATRLTAMGGHLKGGEPPAKEPLDPKTAADLAKNDVEAQALGALGSTALTAYEALLPSDGGEAAVLEQPKDVQRFAAAFLTWRGGSNFTDQPVVKVQRKVGSEWQDFADQTGEIPVTLEFPQNADVPSYLTGSHEWKWTATFEAFSSNYDLTAEDQSQPRPSDSPTSTPAGTYRFVVDGHRRTGLGVVAEYRLESEEFEVSPWQGVTVEDLRVEDDGTVSFGVGPRSQREAKGGGGPDLVAEIGPIDYPDSYASPVKFIRDEKTFIRDPEDPDDASKLEWYCFDCTFRPWADAGDAEEAFVTIVRHGGGTNRVAAHREGGRWVTNAVLTSGDKAYVEAGDIEDRFGNTNGARSAEVTR